MIVGYVILKFSNRKSVHRFINLIEMLRFVEFWEGLLPEESIEIRVKD